MKGQDSEKKELRERVENLESTVQKMMPSRRDAIKMAGAGALGAAAFSGTGSAATPGGNDGETGTIGTSGNPVDLFADDVDVAKEATVQDLTVNGTATGVGGGIQLESTDTLTLDTISQEASGANLVTLFSGAASTILGGTINGTRELDWKYTFSDGNTINLNGGDSYDFAPLANAQDGDGTFYETVFLPPAKDVTQVDVANGTVGALGARLYRI